MLSSTRLKTKGSYYASGSKTIKDKPFLGALYSYLVQKEVVQVSLLLVLVLDWTQLQKVHCLENLALVTLFRLVSKVQVFDEEYEEDQTASHKQQHTMTGEFD